MEILAGLFSAYRVANINLCGKNAMSRKTIAAVVVNDRGDILPYTVQPTKDQCEEHAAEFFGNEVWGKVKALGGRVAQCEITLLE